MSTTEDAKGRVRVTPLRLFTGKLSGSRNGTPEGWPEIDADRCHFCRDRFGAGQMRYPIKDDLYHTWGVVSICMDCFKCDDVTECMGGKLERFERQCEGCSEPLLIPNYWCYVCSTRCYQRYRRKRRHEGRTCKACRKWFHPSRKDAVFCSDKCRQWTYRRRKQSEASPQ